MEPPYSHRGHVLSLSKGFTLIELMVVLTIMTVLTGVILSSQSSFNKTLVLTNTAFDIALTMRSAATYGLSSRGSSISLNAGYGLHFSNSSSGSFMLFSDISPLPDAANCHGLPPSGASAPDAKPGNCVYDGASENISAYTIGNGITVSNFCAKSGSWSCAQTGDLSSLDIVFVRPNPNPFISVNGAYSIVSPITAACLSVVSPQGGVRHISVAASGQIIANAAACP